MGKILRYEHGHGARDMQKQWKVRYRLYADGSIVDQKDNNRVVAWITNVAELDEVFRMRIKDQQEVIMKYVEEALRG